jgi:hypothetical protein
MESEREPGPLHLKVERAWALAILISGRRGEYVGGPPPASAGRSTGDTPGEGMPPSVGWVPQPSFPTGMLSP